jgi:hypothetical protein
MPQVSINDVLFLPLKKESIVDRDKPTIAPKDPHAISLWGELRLVSPDDPRFTTKERNALNNALQSAWDARDPVRWILVRARAELLGLTANRYAAEIGMASHSLVTKEQKGGENVSPSSFSLFFQDWERRSHSDAQHGQHFSRASKLLMHQLLGKTYVGIPGLVTRWQCRVGAAEFERRTKLDPKLLSNYRTHGFNPHFSELLDIARRAELLTDTKGLSLWGHPTVVEARREFLHQSLRRGRSLSTTLLRCAMELKGERPTDENIHKGHPFLKEQERKMLLRYDLLSVPLFETILKGVVEQGSLHPEEAERLRAIRVKEQHRTPSPPRERSIKAIEKRQLVEGLPNAKLAALFEGFIRGVSGDAREHVRRGIQRVDESSRVVPFGIVAFVLAESPKELKEVLQARRAELTQAYLKRFGTQISPESIERRVWGLSESDIKSAGDDILAAALRKVVTLGVPVKQKLMRRFVMPPGEFVAAALELFPHNTLGHRAQSSAEMLGRIAAGDVYPHRSLYKRIVEASLASLSPTLDLLWYDRYATQYKAPKGKTEFGAIQCRILDSLVAARGENQRHLLLQHSDPLQAQRASRELLKLERSADIPLATFHEILGHLGVGHDSAEISAITALTKTKSYPVAIASWFREEMPGASPELRDAARRILTGPELSIHKEISNLPTDPAELLDLRSHWAQGSPVARQTPLDTMVKDSCHLMRTFPGASLADLEQARRELNHAGPRTAALEFAWSRCAHIPTKGGSLYIEPTTTTGARISRQTAATLARAIHCPAELVAVLQRDSLVILNQLDHVDCTDPWSGSILRPERMVSAEDIKAISEVLLPVLLPALSLKEGVAENLLRWQKALWSHPRGADEVVQGIRNRQLTLATANGQPPNPLRTPMAILDAAILVASAYRKRLKRVGA